MPVDRTTFRITIITMAVLWFVTSASQAVQLYNETRRVEALQVRIDRLEARSGVTMAPDEQTK
jgi:hypothetical protein